ncbi:MAG: glutamate--tRNA ligase [Candidatus Colwellbacteria bacterium]|nr:glutamate--tRNA ligase [Candidatus Colwellbacteria bacterium]
MNVKVRYAPSPTGPHHIGGARTALFNWLFARREKGIFVLRIEDTDRERSKPEFEEEIKNTLQWLGLNWDEFYRQSERLPLYEEHLKKLLNENWIYYCFCSKEELEAERQAMMAGGLAAKYSGRCRNLSKEQVQKHLEAGESYTLRLKMPETKLTFKDLIRGQITFDTTLIGDVIIAKDFNQPLYNFAVVVDDALMNITHVIRGEEHISNTPLQIVLAKALELPLPQFAHLPLILNPDRSKMSKRFADTSLKEYIDGGYLMEAVVNFLAYLGWHPKEDKEVMGLEEIVKEFDLNRVQKGGAVFNPEKLDWLNSHYMKNLPLEELIPRARQFVPPEWQMTPAIVNSVRGRIKDMSELKELAAFYFQLPEYPANLLQWQEADLPATASNLLRALELVSAIPEEKFNQKFLEESLLAAIVRENRGDILWPLRVALSGLKASPSPFEIMEALGKEESLHRINLAIEKIGNSSQIEL